MCRQPLRERRHARFDACSRDQEVRVGTGIGDAAAGVPVLTTLYARMKDEPAPVDLDALWLRLGVRAEGGSVRFDEAAPLATVRRSMTAAPHA